MTTTARAAQADVNGLGNRKLVSAQEVPDTRSALRGVLNLEPGVTHDKTVEQLPRMLFRSDVHAVRI